MGVVVSLSHVTATPSSQGEHSLQSSPAAVVIGCLVRKESFLSVLNIRYRQ